jgi:uncharacterized membrane protein
VIASEPLLRHPVRLLASQTPTPMLDLHLKSSCQNADMYLKFFSLGVLTMEFFFSTQLTVPVTQVMMLLAFTTIALLFGKTKLALIVNYLFVLHWGFVFNGNLLGFPEQISTYTITYFGFGLGIVVLALIGFLARNE